MPEYLITYDICAPKRLSKMHRYLKKLGMPIQYSVFYMVLSERQLETCLAGAARIINPKQDDLRCYPLPKRGLRWRMGRVALPSGIMWSGLPSQWVGDNSGEVESFRQSPSQHTEIK